MTSHRRVSSRYTTAEGTAAAAHHPQPAQPPLRLSPSPVLSSQPIFSSTTGESRSTSPRLKSNAPLWSCIEAEGKGAGGGRARSCSLGGGGGGGGAMGLGISSGESSTRRAGRRGSRSPTTGSFSQPRRASPPPFLRRSSSSYSSHSALSPPPPPPPHSQPPHSSFLSIADIRPPSQRHPPPAFIRPPPHSAPTSTWKSYLLSLVPSSSTSYASQSYNLQFPVSPSLLRPRPTTPAVKRRRKTVKRVVLIVLCVAGVMLVLGYNLHPLSGERHAPLRILDDPPDVPSTPFEPNADPPLLPSKPEPYTIPDRRARALAEKKRKKALKYKRLLPIVEEGRSRRHIYGANLQPHLGRGEADQTEEEPGDKLEGGAEDDAEEEEEEPAGGNTNKKNPDPPTPSTLRRWFVEGKAKYEREAEGWRGFEWGVPLAHASLGRAVRGLSEDEQALRRWIYLLHTASPPTVQGLGLASSQPSSRTPPLPEMPQALVDTGSDSKWDRLRIGAKAAGEGDVGQGMCEGKFGEWLEEYRVMQEEMLDGRREPKFISYHCEQGMNCGGLGDRLLGMTSAFYMGLMTNRAFLAEWQTPIPLDVVFDSPAGLNWSYSSFTSHEHPVLSGKELREGAKELDIVHFDRLSMDLTFGSTSWNPKKGKRPTPGFEARDAAFQSSWIKLFTNRGLILRSFRYPHLRNKIAQHDLHPHSAFACISRFLFRPKQESMKLIGEYTSLLGLPGVFSVGIQIRTGDKSMKDPEYDLQNTVERHSPFFACASSLAHTYAHPTQRILYYLVTDSAHLKIDAQRLLGDQLVVTDTVPQHVHQQSGHEEGVLGAVVEEWVLGRTDYRVITQDSGFGKLASFSSAREQTTVTLFPEFNEDVKRSKGRKSHLVSTLGTGMGGVDCSRPEALASFEEIASEWSLG